MKRLHRRVRNSEQPTGMSSENVSKALTFDRQTFLECSSRMRRLVPTLSRQHNQMSYVSTPYPCQESTEMSTFEKRLASDNEDESDHCEDDTDNPRMTIEKPNGLTRETCLGHQKSSNTLSLTKEHATMKIDAFGAFATFPRNPATMTSVAATADTGSTTLPTTITVPTDKSPTSRRIWLKPLTGFVAFMSRIGDNIDITSYPSP